MRLSRAERGAALFLTPALVLVVLALGVIAVDLSTLHAQRRHLHAVVSTAADDGAAMLDTTHLQLTGELRIDPDAARRTVDLLVRDRTVPGQLVEPARVRVLADGSTLEVRATVRVRRILAPALRTGEREERLEATAFAVIER